MKSVKSEPHEIEGQLAPVNYPYYATKERAQQIRENYRRIEIGMDVRLVEKYFGVSDSIQPLFEPKMYKPRQIGRSHWYYIQVLKARGSVDDRAEVLVRVSYNLDGKVMCIDHWGFDEEANSQERIPQPESGAPKV